MGVQLPSGVTNPITAPIQFNTNNGGESNIISQEDIISQADITSQEDIVDLIGNHYVQQHSPGQNLLNYVLNGGKLPTVNIIVIRGLEFSLNRGQNVDWPTNMKFEQCRLVSGDSDDAFGDMPTMEFYLGDITTTAPYTELIAYGENTVANANAEHSRARSFRGATANANVPKSVAISSDAEDDNNGRDFISIANANADGSEARARGMNAVANETAAGAHASAILGGTVNKFDPWPL